MPAYDSFIPQAAPGLRFRRFRDDINQAIQNCLDSDFLIMGPQTRAFEEEFAAYLGLEHAVSCNSGTDALFLALMAWGIGEGDVVVIPSLTAAGTAMAVTRTGAVPRFIDVSCTHRCMDPGLLERVLTPRVKAVIVVHLHGNPAPIEEIMTIAEHNSLMVLEDCAQAVGGQIAGKHVGGFAHAAAFSFYPTKNLGCMGDGGAVVTDDRYLAAEMASIRNYGWDADRQCERAGINSRLDEIQAAILRVLLPHLDDANAERMEPARRYGQMLSSAPAIKMTNFPGSVYHQFVIEVDGRDELMAWLASKGIGTGVHYRDGLHTQPFFRQGEQGRGVSALPVTEQLCATMLSLPIQPELMDKQSRIVDALLEGMSEC